MFSPFSQGVYAQIGLYKLAGVGNKLCKGMYKEIKLEVDGKQIELPTVEGIIILNIMRWGGY